MHINDQLHIQSNYFLFLTLIYSVVIVYANWFDTRLIKMFGLINDAQAFVFPLTFLVSCIITEVYGFKYARQAIWTGFLFNCFFLGYGQIVMHLRLQDFPERNEIGNLIFYNQLRIIIASMISCLFAELLNAFAQAKMKLIFCGKFVVFRFLGSTLLALSIDSLLFIMLGFYGHLCHERLCELMACMWYVKIIMTIIALPFSAFIANKLKRLEKIDIYDTNDNFKIFKLETSYQQADNFWHHRCYRFDGF